MYIHVVSFLEIQPREGGTHDSHSKGVRKTHFNGSQATLLSATLSPSAKSLSRLWKKAVRQLHTLWQSHPHMVPKYISQLLADEESLASLCLLAVLADYCHQNSQLEASHQVDRI